MMNKMKPRRLFKNSTNADAAHFTKQTPLSSRRIMRRANLMAAANLSASQPDGSQQQACSIRSIDPSNDTEMKDANSQIIIDQLQVASQQSSPQTDTHLNYAKNTTTRRRNQQHQQRQQQQQQLQREYRCSACSELIRDKFLLVACDSFWHENCLRCDRCEAKLVEIGATLYRKCNMNLCRQDYLEMFGQTAICSVCDKLIFASEMVMRARNNVYHLECFACQLCGQRFCVGDRFYLCENKIVCQFDYEEHILPIQKSLIEQQHNNHLNQHQVEQEPIAMSSTSLLLLADEGRGPILASSTNASRADATEQTGSIVSSHSVVSNTRLTNVSPSPASIEEQQISPCLDDNSGGMQRANEPKDASAVTSLAHTQQKEKEDTGENEAKEVLDGRDNRSNEFDWQPGRQEASEQKQELSSTEEAQVDREQEVPPVETV